MQWLSVWLQETNFPYPGPKCQDGRLLRSSRIDRSLCAGFEDTNQRGGSASDSSFSGDNANHLPLLNEHGDIFQRDLQEEFSDECEVYDISPGERPLAGESEYFYDQYVDYTPSNETNSHVSTDAPISHTNIASNSVLSTQKKPPISANIDLNNTILNTNYFKRQPQPAGAQTSSPFTFFGYPIPSLSLGRFFGAGQRGRKDRGEKTSTASTVQTTASSTERGLAPMSATHRIHTPHGKVRMYQPNSAEFEKYLNPPDSQYPDVSARNRQTTTIAASADSSSDETTSSEAPISVFKTAFREPTSVEHGGFRPIMPEHVGGFMPVHDPSKRRGVVQPIPTPTKYATKNTERDYIPIVAEAEHEANNHEQTNILSNLRPTIAPLSTTALTTEESASEEFESQTYYVTENPTELTTPAHHITPPYVATTTPTTTMNIMQATTTPSSTRNLPRTIATITTTPTPFHTTTIPTSITTTTSTTRATISTQTSTYNTGESDNFDTGELYDDLEAQSVGMLKPPPLIQTTTAETILLIPPPEEHVEQIKRHSWVMKTTTTTQDTPSNTHIDAAGGGSGSLASAEPPTTPLTAINVSPRQPRPSGGRSIITKVQTPQYLPTAEEYHRTTPYTHRDNTFADPSAFGNQQDILQQQLLSAAHKGDYNAPESLDAESVDTAATAYQQIERAERKEGMDWYYESFKKPRPDTAAGSSLRSSVDVVGNGGYEKNACNFIRLSSLLVFFSSNLFIFHYV